MEEVPVATLPAWAIIHSLEGEELEKLRRYNTSRIHLEWIDQDRFRYTHKVTCYGKVEELSCGTKYNATDNSECMVCQAARYGRTEEEAVDAWYGAGGAYPFKYTKEGVLEAWEAGIAPQPLQSWKDMQALYNS